MSREVSNESGRWGSVVVVALSLSLAACGAADERQTAKQQAAEWAASQPTQVTEARQQRVEHLLRTGLTAQAMIARISDPVKRAEVEAKWQASLEKTVQVMGGDGREVMVEANLIKANGVEAKQ